MLLYLHWFTLRLPFLTYIPELADQFLLLRVHRNARWPDQATGTGQSKVFGSNALWSG